MPVGTVKNLVYGLALPVLGQRPAWRARRGGEEALARALWRKRCVGACVQRFEKGSLSECVCVGYAALEPQKRPVAPDTVFRTASVAKMVTALLVFRLQTLGRLSVTEDISDLLGRRVCNPHCPEAPITLGMLLSHTSGIVDSPAYFDAFGRGTPLSELLDDPRSYLPAVPGTTFRYSNLAAGMVASLLEKRFDLSFEQLMQRELLEPLGVSGTFDPSGLDAADVADSYRVLPPARAFCAAQRIASAEPMKEPDPERRYLPAAGNLFITAPELARLVLVAWGGGNGFLDARSLEEMRRPVAGWPEKAVNMRHGMGLLTLDDPAVCSRRLWGHQGFAYGAVNGVFFDEEGSGFVLLDSGCSEQRVGHLAQVNRELIRLCLDGGKDGRP